MTIAAQIGRVNASLEHATKTREFVALARTIALSQGEHATARMIASEQKLSPTVQAVLNGPRIYDKTVVAPGNTVDGSFAGPLVAYQNLAAAWLGNLKNFGGFDRLFPSMIVVPLRSRAGFVSTGATAAVVPEGHVKQISALVLAGGTVTEQKVVAQLVITKELAEFGVAASDLFSNELSNAVAVTTDSAFIAILTAGVTAIASGGVTAEHARHDLRLLLASITTNARSKLFLLMTSATAKALSLMHANTGEAAFNGLTFNGGEISGIVVVVSDGVPSGQVILVDAQQVAAASESIALDSSKNADVQLDSSPDSPPSSGTLLRSMWTNNEVVIRATRYWGATKLTSSGVAVLTGATYSGDSPGP